MAPGCRPREDLRRRKPLDAAQFAVHLDRVTAGTAPHEYQNPEPLLARTYITEGLKRFAGEVLRRLAGEREGANAVLNLVTGFGGGKTHALTLLYHLTRLGPDARTLPGVWELLDAARLTAVPGAAVATFVGTDWNALEGRADPGEPRRRTPWGEIAWQLARQTGHDALFETIRAQDEAQVRPSKETIRRCLPADQPVLILMDEVMNFMTAARAVSVGASTLASQFYEFVHNLTDEADARDGLCVVVSLPKSEEEMSAEDEGDYRRLAKVTTRVAEPYPLARDLEIPEIVRRRLFDDTGSPPEIRVAARAYARWLSDHRDLLPAWFPVDNAEAVFGATYPFHPTVLSVFERKWQALPGFQRTRGILRLLAQWVSITYEQGFQGAHADPLVTLGTAPLDDQFFRAAVLDQLGNDALQAAIISDIAGGQAHAERLDAEAPETLRRARIHRKVATAIFFESSGGQVRDRATLPEMRLAVGDPTIELGNVETALEGLRDACYFLAADGGEYRFSTKPNLNRLLADRRAALDAAAVEEHARAAVREVFTSRKGLVKSFDLVFFPEESRQVPDAPALRLVVLGPDQPWGESTRAHVERWMSEHGASPRRFRNALIWSAPDAASDLADAARRDLAWQTLADEADARGLDEAQRTELGERHRRARADLAEAVWRAYRWLAFHGHDGSLAAEDLGLVHSSAAPSLQGLVQARLRQADELTESLGPQKIGQNWPRVAEQQTEEWSTKALRDAVYASPAFTRLLDPAALKETIAKGVERGLFGYAAKTGAAYVSVSFSEQLASGEVEFSDDLVLLTSDLAQQVKAAKPSINAPAPSAEATRPQPAANATGTVTERPPLPAGEKVAGIAWEGEIPWQKWTTFYHRVLSDLAKSDLELTVRFESHPRDGLLKDRVEAVRTALRELGLPINVKEEPTDTGDTHPSP